jgi:large subunit ribosomal protein L1
MTGKKHRTALEKVDRKKRYGVQEAMTLVKGCHHSKFDESVDVAVNLGVDPKHADQMVRGAVLLPHGTGTKVRVAVFAKGDKERDARDAGADIVGAEDLAEKITSGFMDFDKVIAAPDMMGIVGKLGKVLGPRGLMPNPKVGTVTPDVGKAVRETKAGKIEFRVDKYGIVHARVGRVSFEATKLAENFGALMETIMRLKPSTSKGAYVESITVNSTMGPGVKLDVSAATAGIKI